MTPSVEERFWAKVDKSGDCWLWTASTRNGYGQFFDGERIEYAHRFVYARFVGPLMPGLKIDHLCRTPACVNPAHLELVTNAENIRRGLRTHLTHEDAAFIRESSLPTRELADRFGVSDGAIYKIRLGERWVAA